MVVTERLVAVVEDQQPTWGGPDDPIWKSPWPGDDEASGRLDFP
jgi:hypothetical protein